MNSIRRGLCLVLGEMYGLDMSETYECLTLCNWDTEVFRIIANDCMWAINTAIFKEKLYASTLLLRHLVPEWRP